MNRLYSVVTVDSLINDLIKKGMLKESYSISKDFFIDENDYDMFIETKFKIIEFQCYLDLIDEGDYELANSIGFNNVISFFIDNDMNLLIASQMLRLKDAMSKIGFELKLSCLTI